jgi:cytochrome b involved in lipid metabolism
MTAPTNVALILMLAGIQEKLKAVKTTGDKSRRCNLKRLIRSEIYCTFATLSGAYILYNEYHQWPMDLIHHWSSTCTTLFEIALAHWLFSIFEDRSAGQHIISHILAEPEEKQSLYAYYSSNLLNHHIITIFAYGFSLYSHKLSALCVFGLLFEAPILILTYRDICVCFDEEMMHPIRNMDAKVLKSMWGGLYMLWHLCRTGSCLLYPISLIFWRTQLSTLQTVPWIVYHLLGCLFIYVNWTLLVEVLPRLVEDDHAMNGLVSDEARKALRSEMSKKRRSDGGHDEEDQLLDNSGTAQQTKHSLKTSGTDSMGKKLLGPVELSKHNTTEDLWIAIEGHAYDITAFQKAHPGGSEVLLQCAGQDASKEFLAAGHSQQARKKMARFRVGQMLGHGYDQTGDVDLDRSLMGDMNAPYETGKSYTTRHDPFSASYPVYFISLIFLGAVVREVVSNKNYRNYNAGMAIADRVNVLAAFEPAAVISLSLCLWSVVIHVFSLVMKNIKVQNELIPSWAGMGHPFSYKSFGLTLLDWKVHVCGLGLLVQVASLWAMLACDTGGHNHGLRCMRTMLVLTFASEFIYRKFAVQPRHPDIATPYKDFVLNAGYIFCPCVILGMAACVDVFCTGLHSAQSVARDNIEASQGEKTNGENDSIGYDTFTVMGAIVFAMLSRSLWPRLISSAFASSITSTRPSLDIFSCVMASTLLSFVYGCIVHMLFAAASNAKFATVSLLFTFDFSLIILWGFATLVATYSLVNTVALTQWSTPHFAIQTTTIGSMILLWAVAPPLGIARWVVFGLVTVGLGFLSDEGYKTMDILPVGECPKWIYGAKQIEDLVRHTLALLLHTVVGRVVIQISSTIAPRGQVRVNRCLITLSC